MKISKKTIDLTNNKIGNLLIIGIAGRDKSNKILWRCLCDCGVICIKLGERLNKGKTKSCGCKRSKNLVGKQFGYWTVLRGIKAGKVKKWLCKCICGTEKEVWASSLCVGKSLSCGCKNIEIRIKNGKPFWGTHFLSKHPLYKIYRGMINRCYNANQEAYKWYGAKGIRMCEEWLDSFECFYNWSINNCYNKGLTIDRINPRKNYTPKNCRWISQSENSSRIHRYKRVGNIYNNWLYVKKIPYSNKCIVECVKCKKRKEFTAYFVTSNKVSFCKCIKT